MKENTHRFSRDQQVNDITMLLWQCGSLCIDQMHTLLYGTDHKHGYLFEPIDKSMYEDQRSALLDCMMDIAQELDITQDEITASWQRVQERRKESQEWGKQWLPDVKKK